MVAALESIKLAASRLFRTRTRQPPDAVTHGGGRLARLSASAVSSVPTKTPPPDGELATRPSENGSAVPFRKGGTSTPPAEPAAPGFGFATNLGDRFDLGPVLGSGGSGVVRVATCKRSGARYACKSIPKARLGWQRVGGGWRTRGTSAPPPRPGRAAILSAGLPFAWASTRLPVGWRRLGRPRVGRRGTFARVAPRGLRRLAGRNARARGRRAASRPPLRRQGCRVGAAESTLGCTAWVTRRARPRRLRARLAQHPTRGTPARSCQQGSSRPTRPLPASPPPSFFSRSCPTPRPPPPSRRPTPRPCAPRSACCAVCAVA